MNRISRLVAATTVVLLSACSGDSPTSLPDISPLAGKAPSNSVATATWQVFDLLSSGTASSVTSDGKGAYANGLCGVEAKIFYWGDGGAGDATFDPDASYNKRNCASPRRWNIRFPDGTTMSTGNFISALKMSTIPAGTTTVANVSFTVDRPNCTRVLFRDQVVTRTTTAAGKAQWQYESGPLSTAICRASVNGVMTDIGAPLAMSLKIHITQN